MQVFILTFIFFGLAMLGLAVGWLFNNRALKGSCGGISNLPGMENHACSCSNPCEKKRKQMAAAKQNDNGEKIIEFKV